MLLKKRFVGLLIASSLCPMLVISIGAWAVFGKILRDKTTEHLTTVVTDHSAAVELFLAERINALSLIANTYSKNEISDPGNLQIVFDNLNKVYPMTFIDLGIIDDQGNHLAYRGPYDLIGKNYRDAFWFDKVKNTSRYISNVFIGHRKVPHFIMAVRKDESNSSFWILRTTVNPEMFGQLVALKNLGRSVDSFIVDKEGRHQTSPRSGAAVFSKSVVEIGPAHSGIRTSIVKNSHAPNVVRLTRWLNDGQWMLVVQQDQSEVDAPIAAAAFKGSCVFAVGAALIVLAAVFTTNYLVRLIEKTNKERDDLNRQLIRAGRLASLGELATGLAHEINNPLGIMHAEQTNIADLIAERGDDDERSKEMMGSVQMTKKQIDRCKVITQKMLQFGRRDNFDTEKINIARQLGEIVNLMAQHARINNIEICYEVEGNLPAVSIDDTEFQQIITNLITNAIQAIGHKGGGILISAWSESGFLHLDVEDTGPGVPEDQREHIFEPFFTTKPVGKGTGLGLSVCYGIVSKWKGRIFLDEHRQGPGALFHIQMPLDSAAQSHRA